jgi:hypothetical protein
MGDSENVTINGLEIICLEENARMGDTFFSSNDAFKASNFHNSQTGHNAKVVPCTNC